MIGGKHIGLTLENLAVSGFALYKIWLIKQCFFMYLKEGESVQWLIISQQSSH